MLRAVLLLVAAASNMVNAHADPDKTHPMDTYAAKLQADTNVVGVGIAASVEGVWQGEGVAGLRASSSDVAIETGDLWHVGSITKSMTSTLVGRLVDAGQLNFELTVADILAEEIETLDDGWANATIETLMNHRSGLSANINTFSLLTYPRLSDDPRGDRLRYATTVLSEPPQTPPGEAFEYSNSGYVVLAAMLELQFDSDWEDLIEAHLFEPLGLDSAGFGPPGSISDIDQPRGHRAGLFPGTKRSMPPRGNADNPAVLGPAGRVHISLRDLVTYGEVHISGRAPDGSVFLTEDTLSRLHQPIGDYAAGWVVSPPSGLPSKLWHNGSNTIWYAELYVDPTSETVVAMASNDPQFDALGPAFRGMAERLIGRGD